jgi:type II secretory pathway pseudopilin PulG
MKTANKSVDNAALKTQFHEISRLKTSLPKHTTFSSLSPITRDMKTSHQLSPRDSLGFSLTETLFVVAITGMLIAASVPKISDIANRLVLRSEASSIRLFLERTFNFSLASRETIKVALNSGELIAAMRDNTPLFSYRLKGGISLAPVSSPLIFYPTIAASPQTLLLKKGQSSCSVIISLRGRIRFSC